MTNESAAATGKATIAVHARRADDGTLLSAVVDFAIDHNFPVAVTVRVGFVGHPYRLSCPVLVDLKLLRPSVYKAESFVRQ